jgi:hypothetical protein
MAAGRAVVATAAVIAAARTTMAVARGVILALDHDFVIGAMVAVNKKSEDL